MAKIVKFQDDFYDDGVVKYAGGSFHPLNSETQSLVNSGYADLIDTETTDEVVPALNALAEIAEKAAADAQANADELLKEAKAARSLANTAAKTGKKPAPDTSVEDQALKDLKLSAKQPIVINFPNGNRADSAEVSRTAFTTSGLTAVAWNALTDDDREALIKAEVDKQTAANPTV